MKRFDIFLETLMLNKVPGLENKNTIKRDMMKRKSLSKFKSPRKKSQTKQEIKRNVTKVNSPKPSKPLKQLKPSKHPKLIGGSVLGQGANGIAFAHPPLNCVPVVVGAVGTVSAVGSAVGALGAVSADRFSQHRFQTALLKHGRNLDASDVVSKLTRATSAAEELRMGQEVLARDPWSTFTAPAFWTCFVDPADPQLKSKDAKAALRALRLRNSESYEAFDTLVFSRLVKGPTLEALLRSAPSMSEAEAVAYALAFAEFIVRVGVDLNGPRPPSSLHRVSSTSSRSSRSSRSPSLPPSLPPSSRSFSLSPSSRSLPMPSMSKASPASEVYGIAHNDVHSLNILFDESSRAFVFIDFESATADVNGYGPLDDASDDMDALFALLITFVRENPALDVWCEEWVRKFEANMFHSTQGALIADIETLVKRLHAYPLPPARASFAGHAGGHAAGQAAGHKRKRQVKK